MRRERRQLQVTNRCERHDSSFSGFPAGASAAAWNSSIAFLIFAAAMWAAWRRDPRVAVFLFALGMLFTLAVYLHHATDALPLSF